MQRATTSLVAKESQLERLREEREALKQQAMELESMLRAKQAEMEGMQEVSGCCERPLPPVPV